MINLKNIKRITFICIMLISVFSCKKDQFLDTVNKGNLDDKSMWATETSATLFLNPIYSQLPHANGDMTANLEDNNSDDATTRSYFGAYNWHAGLADASNASNRGIWSPATQLVIYNNDWEASYTLIRNLNNFILNVKKNAANYSSDFVAQRVDEAKVLRAFFYSELFIHFGGVVILTKPQSRQTMTADELKLPRSTFEETFNFIIAELDTVLNNGKLPVKYRNTDADAGRATLGLALELKGYLQLYAASPAFNSSSPAVNDPGNLQHFATPDPSRWATAAATNKKFIDTWGHKGEGIYTLFNKMKEFYWEANEYNSEVIFDMQFVAFTKPNNWDLWGGPSNVDIGGNGFLDIEYAEYQPTQAIIDQYQMANGKYITDPGSGYDEQHPYTGREPRFYKDIVYDGCPYYRKWMSKTDTLWIRIDKVHPSLNEIDFGGANDATQTGYFFQKQLSNNKPGYTDNGQNWVFYRYTEVLLQYAEAQNEAVGPDASVYEAINTIRTRPGTDLPELTTGLTKEQMREEIRHERRIELAFEQKRFRDIVRWKTAEVVLPLPVVGMKCSNSKPDDNSGKWVYERFEPNKPHVFLNRMYFCPIPQYVIDRNPKLIQNMGY